MNRKRFEIWEKYQQKKYEVDLEELREELSGNGLAFSGPRGRKEKYLKEKNEAEIEMERAAMEAEERGLVTLLVGNRSNFLPQKVMDSIQYPPGVSRVFESPHGL